MRATSRFDRDTRVTASSDGSFEAAIDPGWWISRGPNGGYLAAILLRAFSATVADPERTPRSFTTHFTRAPARGGVRIGTSIERSGRSLTTVSGRMHQGDSLCAVGLAAFSKTRTGLEFQHRTRPAVPPPERCERLIAETETVTIRERYEQRGVPGAESEFGTGGWIRLREGAPADAALVAAFLDAWPPPTLERARSDQGIPVLGLPTVELTIHFRSRLPLPDARSEDFYLALFRSRTARDGFVEEDGEIWSRDGILIAESRQLAAFLGPPAR